MFFLLRCAFWLGLVFFNMEWKIEEPILPSAADLAGQATQQCLDNPMACAKIIDTAKQLYAASVTPEPAIPPKAPLPAKVSPKAAAAKTSADSLRVEDRAPTWHGHH